MSGAVSYHGGLAAETQVARHYADRGYSLAATRWRGRGGEIDLILRDGGRIIFVEVKRSASFARAAESLGRRQIARIRAAATEFVANEAAGQDTEMRFDLALVNGTGEVEIIENAFWD